MLTDVVRDEDSDATGRGREILLVDDEPHILDLVGFLLKNMGYRVTKAQDGELALRALGAKRFDLVITDLFMPRTNGLKVLEVTKARTPETAVIVMTATYDQSWVTKAEQLEADGFLWKPFDLQALGRSVKNCMDISKKRPSQTENQDSMP